MESSKPDQEKAEKSRDPHPSPPEENNGVQISLVRKIMIGLFIVGYWVFYYWFQEP